MSGFVFQWMELLFLLLLVLPLAWMLNYARARRAALIKAMGGGLSTHRRLRDYLRIAAFMLLILALARPGYDPQKMSVSRTGRDVVFALDVSQSMLAEDVSPSRLEVSKQAVRDALKTFTNERVGLVVYGGSATILCPLTYDYDFVRYMLEQTHTRSVDFGGTTVQSAVEKVVDQVLIQGRAGVQDLVILTDGGDHGSKMERVAELLDAHGVDLLLLGIGNPHEGSPIPVVDDDGVRTLLRSNESVIYTKLDDTTLRALAAKSRDAVYVPVGNSVFDLGQIYADYVVGREVSASVGEEGIVVYQEAAQFFLIPALLLLLLSECWGANGLQFGQAALFIGAFCCLPQGADAAERGVQSQFEEATALYAAGTYAEADALFADVAATADDSTLSAGEMAAVQLNRGLCLMELSKAEGEASATIGLSYAQQAQLAFLASKRYMPELERSGIRLESTAVWVSELQQRIADEAEAQDALEGQMEELVAMIQALLEAQQALRQETISSDVDRHRPRPKKGQPPLPPVEQPADAGEKSLVLVAAEQALTVEAERIYKEMQQLDIMLTPPPMDGMPPMESLLTEPLKLMLQVPVAMAKASESLVNWSSWPTARAEQTVAEKLLEEILNLLSSQSSDESESDEYDDMDYDEDYEYSDEMDESMMSSMPMEGDLAAGGEMQSLPVPNYSADDILLEEQGSMQFRQQQRAKANAAKVEKDY